MVVCKTGVAKINKQSKYYNKRNVRAGMFYHMIGVGLSALFSFMVALLLIRELSINDYAVYTVITGLLILIMRVSGGGLEGSRRRLAKASRKKGRNSECKYQGFHTAF